MRFSAALTIAFFALAAPVIAAPIFENNGLVVRAFSAGAVEEAPPVVEEPPVEEAPAKPSTASSAGSTGSSKFGDLGKSILSRLAATAGGTIFSEAVSKIEHLFNRTVEARELQYESRQLPEIALDLGKALLGGAASSVGGEALQEIKELFEKKKTATARSLQ